MAEYRKYSKRTKLAVVVAADMVGVTEAAEQAGIPHQTVSHWMDDPELGEIRRKVREDLAEEIKVVAHLAWKRVAETLPGMEPRDALFAADKATSLTLLMGGEATSRVALNMTEGMDDHERELLSSAIRAELARRTNGDPAETAVEPAVTT